MIVSKKTMQRMFKAGKARPTGTLIMDGHEYQIIKRIGIAQTDYAKIRKMLTNHRKV